MSVRRFLEKEVLIHLSEDGFVETIRYFGLPDRRSVYVTTDAKLTDHAGEEQFTFLPVRTRSPKSEG
jgi:hypothetical protein